MFCLIHERGYPDKNNQKSYIPQKIMKNPTTEVCHAAGGVKPPKSQPCAYFSYRLPLFYRGNWLPDYRENKSSNSFPNSDYWYSCIYFILGNCFVVL